MWKHDKQKLKDIFFGFIILLGQILSANNGKTMQDNIERLTANSEHFKVLSFKVLKVVNLSLLMVKEQFFFSYFCTKVLLFMYLHRFSWKEPDYYLFLSFYGERAKADVVVSVVVSWCSPGFRGLPSNFAHIFSTRTTNYGRFNFGTQV